MKQNPSPNIYLFSDPHFFHSNVIKYCKGRQKFKSIEEHDEQLIKNYNNTVKPEDTVIWVGDCFFCKKQKAREIMSRLPGRKILVKGNHDQSNSQMKNSYGFDWSCDEMVYYIQGERVRICHFPYLREDDLDVRYKDRRPIDQGEFLLHGHTHSQEIVNGRMIHVGVDAWNLRPVSINKIASIINQIKKEEQNKGV